MTQIDGLDIHFIHVRSKHENALPLIVTDGWPGSVIEQLNSFNTKGRGYAIMMGTRPQTSYGLADSPGGRSPERTFLKKVHNPKEDLWQRQKSQHRQ